MVDLFISRRTAQRIIARAAVACAIIVLTCGANLALAQTGRPTQDGHALDKNPRVGSGGYNTPAPSYMELNAANRYITGNVTGLGGFHGYSPVADPSQFRTGLGSAGLTLFNRQSVSLGDVLNRQTAAGLPYYSRSETIVGTGGIIAGRNAPGSSTPLSPNVLPGSGSLFQPPPVSELDLRRAGQATAVRPIDANGALVYSPPVAPRTIPYDATYSQAAGSSLFGLSESSMQVPTMVPSASDESLRGRRILSGKLGESSPDSPGDLFSRLTAMMASPDKGGVNALETQARKRVASRAAPSQQADVAELLKRAAGRAAENTREKPERVVEQTQELESSARLSRAIADAPLKTFAQAKGNDVNELLKDGEGDMRSGRYYDAARRFAAAVAADGANPLARLASGHALAAAGDYISAVREITAGLRIESRVALLDMDLTQLMGGREVCRVRIGDLESRLAGHDELELRFLLGYMQYYSGDAASGLANLLKAAKAAPVGTVIARFPEMLLGTTTTTSPVAR